jgi:hypothetical protein
MPTAAIPALAMTSKQRLWKTAKGAIYFHLSLILDKSASRLFAILYQGHWFVNSLCIIAKPDALYCSWKAVDGGYILWSVTSSDIWHIIVRSHKVFSFNSSKCLANLLFLRPFVNF